jgi:hypothetical protein
MAQACNPSYSGGRDQKDAIGSQPGKIVCETLSQKTLHKNRVGGVAQGVALSSSPGTEKKKKGLGRKTHRAQQTWNCQFLYAV